jgi:signal transduction histidine kinase
LRFSRERMKEEDVETAFAVLDTQTARLDTLLSELLSFGRWRHHNGRPPATPVRLLDAVTDAFEAAPLPDFVTAVILATRPEVPPVVLADRAGLARVVVNLLTNAYRYGGSTVTISTLELPGYTQLIVEDDGPGVPDSVVPILFSPFAHGEVPARTAEKGTGLGLALAREIVEAYGGRIHHEGAQPTGARFIVTLPTA